MINIEWKGKIGYGDIVSPICYAHNLSYKLQTGVNLTFRWQHDAMQKTHPADPETLWGRANYIHDLCEKKGTDVNIYHTFETPLKVNHINYDWDVVGKDIYHNYWMPQKFNDGSLSDTILVNSTMNNVMSLEKYGKGWKDPLANQWQTVIDSLSEKYTVRIVDYRTPIEKLTRLLQKSKGFIGYHGTAAWVAKFTHTPSIIFANGGSLTRNAFPYAKIFKTDTAFKAALESVETHFLESEVSSFKLRGDYLFYYKPSEEFQQSLTHGI
jgi:hypothetical protein